MRPPGFGVRTRAALAGVLTLTLLGVLACGRAIDRPLRGAAPGVEATKPVPVGAPPTLQASEALRFRALPSPSPAEPSASPAAAPAASPSPSVAPMPPIVRTIAPVANANVAPGSVTVSAVL